MENKETPMPQDSSRLHSAIVIRGRKRLLLGLHRGSTTARILGAGLVEGIAVEHIASELHIVVLSSLAQWVFPLLPTPPKNTYSKFANFSVVHTKHLRFFTCPKAEARDEIHEK